MEVLIMSRKDIEEYCTVPLLYKTALISITDYQCEFAKLKNPPYYLLQTAFDDVDNDIFVDELGRTPTES
ncbi:MAG: hypothetical protein IJZ89_02175 [Clostridia bacterium]|nr:hypothetical protein [Clostridia bacterium]